MRERDHADTASQALAEGEQALTRNQARTHKAADAISRLLEDEETAARAAAVLRRMMREDR